MKKEIPFKEDLELMKRAKQGEARAREAVACRLRCVSVFVAARNAHCGRPLQHDEVDDLVQDVVMTVWRYMHRYQGKAPLEGWVYSFALLMFKDSFRKKRIHEARKRRLKEDTQRATDPDRPDRDRYEDVHTGLNQISGRQAQIIRLKHFNQMTFNEIAGSLPASLNTVKTHYYRGLIKLRKLLDPRRVKEMTYVMAEQPLDIPA